MNIHRVINWVNKNVEKGFYETVSLDTKEGTIENHTTLSIDFIPKGRGGFFLRHRIVVEDQDSGLTSVLTTLKLPKGDDVLDVDITEFKTYNFKWLGDTILEAIHSRLNKAKGQEVKKYIYIN